MRRVLGGSATLAPSVTASVTAGVGGVVLVLHADLNGVVRRGDVLAVVGPPGGGPGRRHPVRSPIDGVVLERRVSIGDPVEPARTVLYALGNVDALVGRGEVAESSATMIRAGAPVRMRVDAMPGREFESTVGRVDVAITPSHTMGYEFPVANPDHALQPGMSCSAQVIVDTREGALVVPEEAIAREGDDERVFVASEGRASARRVVTGIREGGLVEVTGGLSDGDRVLTPAALVREGDPYASGE
jgi:membrane fusion protein (multidrug efflux system)